jgi:signal transduction histidine kinase
LGVEASLGEEPDLPLEAKEGLYRIAQEALNNAVRHAQASRVAIHLRQDNGKIVLSVKDNGIGFNTQIRYPGHIGLHTMRERAEKLGGVLDVKSAPGQGTHIRATLFRTQKEQQSADW